MTTNLLDQPEHIKEAVMQWRDDLTDALVILINEDVESAPADIKPYAFGVACGALIQALAATLNTQIKDPREQDRIAAGSARELLRLLSKQRGEGNPSMLARH